MGRKSRSRSRGAEPPSPPDVGPPLAGGQDHRAADGIDIVDELFGDLQRQRELADAIIIAEPGANLIPPGPPVLGVVCRDDIISTGPTRPGPASACSRAHESSLGVRASSPRGEVAPNHVSIDMCKDEFLYLTRSPPDRHPSAAWDEQIYLAGVGREAATQGIQSRPPSDNTDNTYVDLEAGIRVRAAEVHHGAPNPETPSFWQRLSAIRRSVWRVMYTVFTITYGYVRPIGSLLVPRRSCEVQMRHEMEQEVQTDTRSLFLGQLRGHSTSNTQGERADAHVQVNDNAEMLIQGSYIPTPRDPFTGEVAAVDRSHMRLAPNGTPFLVPDVERGLITAYFQRKTWRLIYVLKIREVFSSAIFATVDDTIKYTWMCRVFDFANPFPRVRAQVPVNDGASSTDSEMPGLHPDTDSDTHQQAGESSSSSADDGGGDAFADAFRLMMQRNRGGEPAGADVNDNTFTGQEDTHDEQASHPPTEAQISPEKEPEDEPDVDAPISQVVQRDGNNLTRNMDMCFVTYHQFDHGQKCYICDRPLRSRSLGDEAMIDREGRGVHTRCIIAIEPGSPDSAEREERVRTERIAVLEEDLRMSRARLAEYRAEALLVTPHGHDTTAQITPPERPGRETLTWQTPAPPGAVPTQYERMRDQVRGRTGRRLATRVYDSPTVGRMLTISHGDVEAPDAVVEESVGHGAPAPDAAGAAGLPSMPVNPYDIASEKYTRYGARVPASVASQRAESVIVEDTQTNRWPPVSDERPLAAEDAHRSFSPLLYPGYRTLVSAMSQIKNKFTAYVRGMFADELVNAREERARQIWEKRQTYPHRFALGGEWTSAPLIMGREPAHTAQFTKYEKEVNQRTQLARIGPHPTSLWTKKVQPDGTETDDGVLDLTMVHNPPPLLSAAEEEAQAVVDEICPPATRTATSGAAHRAGATNPYVKVYEHRHGQSPFYRYHNMFVQLDRPYDVTKQKGNWFAEDLAMFITSLDRTCRYARHPHTDDHNGPPVPDATEGAILVGIPADVHASVLVPPGGVYPGVPRRIAHTSYYGAGSNRGGSIVQWIGNSIYDDEIWCRASFNQEFAFDLHAMRHERSRVAKKIWQERPENRYREVSDFTRCYPSAPMIKCQVHAKMFDSMFLPGEEPTYSDHWDHNTAHSVGHAGHGSINWKLAFQRRPGSYKHRARLELRRSERGFQRAGDALARKLPTHLEVMPQWSTPVVHDTDFALLALTSFVSTDRVAMWFWHANQAVLDAGQPARVFPLVYVQAHEPFDKPLLEYGKTSTPHADVVRIAFAGRDGRLKTDSFLIKRKRGDTQGWQQADLRDALQLINKCIRILRYRRYNPNMLQIDETIQQRWERRVISAVVRDRTKSWRAAACSNCGYQNLLLSAREDPTTISHCRYIAAVRDETWQLHRARRVDWGVEPRMGLAEARRQEETWQRVKFCPCLTAVWCSNICANDVAHGENHYQTDGHRRYTVLMTMLQTKVSGNREFAKEMTIQILRYLRVLHGHSYGAMPFFWKF